MRLFVLILGLVLMLPAGLYMAWEGAKRSPGLGKVIADVDAVGDYYADGARGLDNFGQLIGRTTRIAQAMGAAQGDNDAMLSGALGVLAADQRAGEVAALAEPAAFSFDRMIRVKRQVTPERFLQPGEALPAPEWREVFLDARLVLMAEELCTAAKGALAADCMIDRFGVEPPVEKDGVQVFEPARITLFFTPKTPVGALPAAATAPELHRERVELQGAVHPRAQRRDPLLLPSDAEFDAALAAALQKADAACVPLRKRLGNCAVQHLWVEETGEASAELAALVPTRAAPGAAPATN